MADRTTLEQRLRDADEPVPDFVACPSCGRQRCRPFEIVNVTDLPDVPGDMACGQCVADDKRLRDQANEHLAQARAPAWETPAGLEMKARRDRMLDKWRWTILPDSPLTKNCQAEFKRYLFSWHRMTIDAAVISGFNEPDVPELEYAPVSEHKRNLGI